jgi:hypothetical protein
MKVWKSPVFYLGVVLLCAVIGALIAPFVVDWNAYRADLETYGRRVTGRDVTIDGPISVRLFPWPSLTATGIHLANPPGLDHVEFARAEKVVVRLQLAGLFNGDILVESIAIDKPVIALERMPSGAVNWQFHPSANRAGNDFMGRVKLDRITLNEATVRLIDRRRGQGEIALHVPVATLASPGLAGPWRVRADKVEMAARAFAVTINTGAWKAGEPLRFSVHVAGSDGSGPAFNFDGSGQGDRVAGILRIEPASNSGGKTDAEGQLRPMVFTSKVVATFDAVALDKIEIAPRDPKDGGTLMSGSARLALGAQISAQADLAAAHLDLEKLAGARANQVLREAGGLAVADAFLALLPEAATLNGSLKVTALKAGGETLENVVLRLEASRAAIRLRELSASLPGRSRALFEGVFFPGKSGAELAGNLAVESNDLRQLTTWVWPEGKDGIATSWTGSRGRLKLQTELSLTQSRFRLDKTQYEIDGVPGSGELAVTLGGRVAVDLRIDTDKLDIDNFSPGGFAAASSGGKTGFTGLLSVLTPHGDANDLRLTMRSKQLLLNGVTASDVVIDLASGANGLDVRSVEIGSVGGARLAASGLILDTGAGPDGSVGIEVEAGDPRGLLRLLGLIPVDREPGWSQALGATEIKGTVTVKTEAAGPVSGFDFAGRSGAFEVSVSGTLSGASDLDRMVISGSGDIKAASSASLVKLAGLLPATDDQTPARLTITGSGSLAEGFLTNLNVQAYGARFDYNGMIGAHGRPSALDGKIALRSTDVMPLLAAMGLPSAVLPTGVLVLDSGVATEGAAILLPDLAGRFGQTPIGGNLKWEDSARITANIEAGDMALGDLLAGTFLVWNGLAPESETGFATELPFGVTGEIWIKPASLKVHDTFTAKDVQVGITASLEEIRLAMFGKDAQGRDAAIELGSRGRDGNRTLDGKMTLPFDLARQLVLAGGAPVAEGSGVVDLRFEAQGRSPGGALAALKGSGSYAVDGLKLLNISPPDFSRLLAAAKDGAGLNAAFDGLRGGGGLTGGNIRGSITVENGVAAFLPFKISTPDADATIRVVAEPALAMIDASMILRLKAQQALPTMEISYAGPPAALARNEDKTELAAKLGFDIMQQGVAELERLQQEQLRMAAEEEKLRLEDEAKLQAYYAQRDELRLRQRELKVHAEMRVLEAEQLRKKIESERAANAEINRVELKQRVREIRIHRRMARLERRLEPVVTVPAPRAKAPATKPPAAKPEVQVPVILVPPARSPSQQ